MKLITSKFIRRGLITDDLACQRTRVSMVIAFLFFGYQASLNDEIRSLIPFVQHRTLILRLCPAFGFCGGTWLPAALEWLFGWLILPGFWNRKLGLPGAFGSSLLPASTPAVIACNPTMLLSALRELPS